MTLNHYAINQVVRGRMVPAGPVRFGRFGVGRMTADLLRHRPRPAARVAFDLDMDRKVRDAFVRVHGGEAAEHTLLDPDLAARFYAAARELGLHASAADLNRRLQNIRKNPARYRKWGVTLPASAHAEPRPSIVPQYAHVIEFSLSRLRSRYGASIDDILIDPDLGREYESMARLAAPDLTSLDLRLAALYIRKTRYIAKRNARLIHSLNADRIEAEFTPPQRLDLIAAADVPDSEGLIEVMERNQYLYISQSRDLQADVAQIASESSLSFMANDFWKPNPEDLTVRVLAGRRFLKVSASYWQLKLINERKPVFNWPIAA